MTMIYQNIEVLAEMGIPRIDGRLIKQLRKNASMTQVELATRAKVTQGYIAQIEGGKVDPKLSIINRIFAVLSDQEQIIKAKDIMTPKNKLLLGNPDQITEELTEKMLENGFSQVPIINAGGYSVGTLIESDLLVKTMKKGPHLRWNHVKEIMSSPLPTFNENTPRDLIEQVLEKLPAILVVNNIGKVTGIITRSDVLKSF